MLRPDVRDILMPVYTEIKLGKYTYFMESGEIFDGTHKMFNFGHATSRVIFNILLSNPNKIISRDILYKEMYKSTFIPKDANGVEVSIYRIRKKLETLDGTLKDRLDTIVGWGYRWRDESIPRPKK